MRTPASMDPIMTARNFVQVPGGIARTYGCPSGLP